MTPTVMIRTIAAALLSLGLASQALPASAQERQSAPSPGAAAPGPTERRLPPFRLVQPSGEPLTERDLQGLWTIVFFGYTSCPDVCPTAITVLSEAIDRLGPDGQRVRGLFVTIDPRRDRPEVIRAYLEHFNRRILGALGSASEVESVARAFGIRYEIHGDTGGMNYTVDHPAIMLVFDPDGRFVTLVPHGATATELTALLTRRMRGARP